VRKFHITIGTFLFSAIAFYLLVSVILYFTTSHVTSYQVKAGTLSKNETYQALVLRDEKLIQADRSGYVNYFVPDGAKAAKKESVCILSDTKGELTGSKNINPDGIRTLAERYASTYDNNNFSSVYDLKYSLNAVLFHTRDLSNANGQIYSAEEAGIVSYSSDGYESKKSDEVTEEDFNTKGYRKKQLTSDIRVESGQPVFRLIESNTWSVVIPVNVRQKEILKDRKTIRVRFEKDGNSELGSLSLYRAGKTDYAKITFANGMVRYCNDRFLKVELVTNTKSGLKIPRTAVVSKEFYVIPARFATKGGSDGDTGFLKEVTSIGGKKSTSFVKASIYESRSTKEKTDQENDPEFMEYYVDKDQLHDGDILLREDSKERFKVGPTGTLEGVYSINRGYAVFRKIKILDQDDESCIVSKGTRYGVAQYDLIARDGSAVKEEQIIK
jgi:hypothetical protein